MESYYEYKDAEQDAMELNFLASVDLDILQTFLEENPNKYVEEIDINDVRSVRNIIFKYMSKEFFDDNEDFYCFKQCWND